MATTSAILDGATLEDGDEIDMFFLAPQQYELLFHAADRVGNAATQRWTFVVRATARASVRTSTVRSRWA